MYLRLHLKVATAEQYFNDCKIENEWKYLDVRIILHDVLRWNLDMW